MPGKPEDLTGKTIYDLTFIKCVGVDKWKRALWKVVCSCPDKTTLVVIAKNVKTGDRKNCGGNFHNSMKGLTTHPLYDRWKLLMRRCYETTFSGYKKYGAKGITVCPEWKTFEGFLTWKEIPYLLKNLILQIDRRNNSKGYSPDNCRLVTSVINNNNRGNNHKYHWKEHMLTLRQIAEMENLPPEAFERFRIRVVLYKWNIENALKTPKMKNQHTKFDIKIDIDDSSPPSSISIN